jgi:CSLREA domain-containing protein
MLSAFGLVALLLTLFTSVATATSTNQTSPAAADTQVEPRYDLTGDGLITQTDVMETIFAWEATRGAEQCSAAPADVNGDGCVTIADVQLVAARVGGRTANAVVRGVAPDGTITPLAALTFVVNSTSDTSDRTPGDRICRTSTGVCTLRAAMQEANLNPGPDTINFGISGTGPHTITISSALPSISDETGGTTINGYSQSGSRQNTDPLMFNGIIKIQIVGSSNGWRNIDAIRLSSSNNVIRGLSVARMRRHIWIGGAHADNNVVAGNFIGLYANGDEWASGGWAVSR